MSGAISILPFGDFMTFKEQKLSFRIYLLYIKSRFLPHRKHRMPTLERLTS